MSKAISGMGLVVTSARQARSTTGPIKRSALTVLRQVAAMVVVPTLILISIGQHIGYSFEVQNRDGLLGVLLVAYLLC